MRRLGQVHLGGSGIEGRNIIHQRHEGTIAHGREAQEVFAGKVLLFTCFQAHAAGHGVWRAHVHHAGVIQPVSLAEEAAQLHRGGILLAFLLANQAGGIQREPLHFGGRESAGVIQQRPHLAGGGAHPVDAAVPDEQPVHAGPALLGLRGLGIVLGVENLTQHSRLVLIHGTGSKDAVLIQQIERTSYVGRCSDNLVIIHTDALYGHTHGHTSCPTGQGAQKQHQRQNQGKGFPGHVTYPPASSFSPADPFRGCRYPDQWHGRGIA